MQLKEFAASLGITEYPEGAEAVYAALPPDDGKLYSEEYLDALHAEYGVLAGVYDEVMEGARALADRPELCLWGRLAVACFGAGLPKALPMPEPDGTKGGDLLAYLVLLQLVPTAYQRYRDRGFSHEVAMDSIGNIPISLKAACVRIGRPAIDGLIYSWIQCFTGASIYRYHSLNFQPCKLGAHMVVLRNRESGECRVVMASGSFHRTGRALGSSGFKDEDGSFEADFRETEEGFFGHVTEEALADPTVSFFPKSEWECVLREGDFVINLHIPRGSDLSPEAVRESLDGGMAMARSLYPDREVKGAVCYSWLLDPIHEELLGKDAKITRFMRLFSTFPLRDSGGAAVTRVFPACERRPVSEYPEDTTLQRRLKQHMLNGAYLYNTGGVILDTLL